MKLKWSKVIPALKYDNKDLGLWEETAQLHSFLTSALEESGQLNIWAVLS
jgi:hypothetical protein